MTNPESIPIEEAEALAEALRRLLAQIDEDARGWSYDHYALVQAARRTLAEYDAARRQG